MSNKNEFWTLIDNINTGTREELLSIAKNTLRTGGIIATPNPVMIVSAMKKASLYNALLAATNIPDGHGLIYAFRQMGKSSEIYPGIELARDLLIDSGADYALIGAAPGIAERAGGRLSQKYNIKMPKFTLDGYNYTSHHYAEKIAAYKPKIVLLGLGSPKQELIALELSYRFPMCLFITVGGSIDVYAGKVKRVLPVMRRLHLEWLGRMLSQPHRLREIPKIINFLSHCRSCSVRSAAPTKLQNQLNLNK